MRPLRSANAASRRRYRWTSSPYVIASVLQDASRSWSRRFFSPLVRPYRSHRWRVRPETLSTTRCWQCERVRISKDEPYSAPKRLPARLPRARALRRPAQWHPSTCKSLRDAVTSAALRKTREAAGWTEWAVVAGRYTDGTDSFIITASSAHRTAPRPDIGGQFAMRASLSSGRDEVIVMENENGSVRSRAYDPRRNRWREIPSLARDLQNIRGTAVGAALGSSIMVLGGTSEMDFHVYDSAQDTWSLQPPQLPFRCSFPHSIRSPEGSGVTHLLIMSRRHLYMILRRAFGQPDRASRSSFMTDKEEFIGTPTRSKCMVSSASWPISS